MKRVKFRDRKSDEATTRYLMALTLCQPRHDKHGNPVPGLTADEVRALSPAERRKLRLQGCGRDLSYENFVNLRFPYLRRNKRGRRGQELKTLLTKLVETIKQSQEANQKMLTNHSQAISATRDALAAKRTALAMPILA